MQVRFDDLPLILLPKPLNTNISLDDVIQERRSADYFRGGECFIRTTLNSFTEELWIGRA
ncbi:hypothetical protein BsIDN1_30600 [Bacillus safensis]|uniref:Uncharacterized protein n=1 Tax=Bacillus safensis TaxID=561879 RepID=A0A5S9MA34_BACIA|nr:hypothetical protein BsIDN1_30600 [Bacillus safensis]